MTGDSANRNNTQHAVKQKQSLAIWTKHIVYRDWTLCHRIPSLPESLQKPLSEHTGNRQA